jgi:hypothetical protein
MRVNGRTVVGLLALAMLVVTPAWADRPQTREGFWISFGGGYGSADADCDGCGGGDRQGDFTGIFKIGGTLNPRFLIGSETNVWVRQESGTSLYLGTLTAAAYFYPMETSGFFLKGGAGFAFATSEVDNETLDGAGWGLMAGAGYDLRIGRNLSLTPSASYYFGKPGNLKLNGTTVLTGWKQNVFDVTLSLTFH